MNRTIVKESDDEFDNDSLENYADDLGFDVDEIPESPSQPNNSTIDDDWRPRVKKKLLIDDLFAKLTTSNGHSLPNGIKVHGNDGKILDYREIISAAKSGKKFNHDFGKMKFKDFKEAKKRLSTIIKDDKTCPKSSLCSENDSDVNKSVAQQMKSVKQVFSILLNKIEESQNNKNIDQRTFFYLESTIGLPKSSPTLEMDKDSLTDSIENCPTESIESDTDEVASLLVQTRKSKPFDSAAIIAEESRMEDDSLDSDSGDDHQIIIKPKKINNKKIKQNESPEMKFVVYQANKKNSNQNKVTSLPIFIGNRVYCEKLFKNLCQHCQNYYSGRKLAQDDISGLVERCSKHRGYRTRYKSPPRFWETDFHSDQDV